MATTIRKVTSSFIYEKGNELLDDAIKKVRGISHNLHSSILKEFGLNEAIIHFVNKITEGTLIKATTSLDENFPAEYHENDISVYRLVQELINNIIKHANATELVVSSEFHDQQLVLTLFHNGKGLTQEQFEELRYKKEGLGLKNIQNRIILLQGKINFETGNEGSNVRIQVPVKPHV